MEWFNAVDATYRSDLRELNELNFARFRTEMEAGFARADVKLEQLHAETQAGFARADAKLEQRLAELETRLTRRMFYFWIGQAATTAALVFGVMRLGG